MRKHLLALIALLSLLSPAKAADSTIAALTAAGAVSGADLLYCTQAGADRKCTATQMATYINSLFSGDFTATSGGVATLKNTGPGATGPLGSATVAPIITIDAQGRVTALSSATVTPALGSITGFGTSVAAALAATLNSSTGPIGALTPTNGNCIQGNGTAWTSAACPGGAGGSIQPVSGVSSTVPGMTAGAAVADTDVFYASQSSGTNDRKVTGAQIKTYSQGTSIRKTTTTSEALADSDRNKLVTFDNSSAVACTIAQAGSGGLFDSTWAVSILNVNTGTVTCTAGGTSVFFGGGASGSTLTLTAGQGCDLYSDGSTGYRAQCGKLGAGSGTVTTTGSPASGNLAAFSGASSITNGNLSGDCATSGTLVANCNLPNSGTVSNRFYQPNYGSPSAFAAAAGIQNTIACRFGVVGRLVTIKALGFNNNVVGTTNVQLAIYANDPATGRPAALIGYTGNISNTTTGFHSGAMNANKQVGPGGADGGREIWFCSNSNDNSANYVVLSATSSGQSTMIGSATGGDVISGNGNLVGVYCQGANCNGGSSTFGGFSSITTLAGTTWSNEMPSTSGVFSPVVAYQAN